MAIAAQESLPQEARPIVDPESRLGKLMQGANDLPYVAGEKVGQAIKQNVIRPAEIKAGGGFIASRGKEAIQKAARAFLANQATKQAGRLGSTPNQLQAAAKKAEDVYTDNVTVPLTVRAMPVVKAVKQKVISKPKNDYEF